MKTTRSATSLAKFISCVTIIIVSPSCASFFMTFSTSPTISGSSADVGSSNSMSFGSMQRARAIATRCFWPPEIVLTSASAKFSMPTSRRCFIAVSCASFFDLPSTLICGVTQFFKTFMLLNRLNCWKHMPTFARYALTFFVWRMSSPNTLIVPLSACSSRLMQRRSVDFPEPERPIRQTTSPSETEKSTPFSTSSGPKLL